MSSDNLRELLIEELKDIYNAENQLVKALPKMAKAAQNEKLKAGFLGHLEETKGHVERLEQAFELLGEPAKGKLCHAMKGLVEEGAEAIEDNDASPIRDAQLKGGIPLRFSQSRSFRIQQHVSYFSYRPHSYLSAGLAGGGASLRIRRTSVTLTASPELPKLLRT